MEILLWVWALGALVMFGFALGRLHENKLVTVRNILLVAFLAVTLWPILLGLLLSDL